jgi:hypothetical protein
MTKLYDHVENTKSGDNTFMKTQFNTITHKFHDKLDDNTFLEMTTEPIQLFREVPTFQRYQPRQYKIFFISTGQDKFLLKS